MKNKQYAVVIPDVDYYENQIACMTGCPVLTNAGGYVQAIHQGDLKRAYEIARAPNPLASICGRICAHPCELRCRRSAIDQPVSIRALKRVVTERYGPESVSLSLKDQVRQLTLTEGVKPLSPSPTNRIPVAVIGAGPAGLACAHDLAVLGYRVTVFDAAPMAGGMLVLGIPEYRLPRDLVRAEIQAILELGIELKLNKKLGNDFSIATLREEGFQAFFLAIGTGKSRLLNIPGTDLDGAINGIDFLLNVNLGYHVELGRRVVVVGGGNVAMDVARTALRQEERISDGPLFIDTARVAIRLGAREVHMVALESLEELPASHEELAAAREEGIQIHFRKGPSKILGRNGKVTALETLDVASVFDEEGRFNPRFTGGTESFFPTDTVLLAIGQQPDVIALRSIEKLNLNPNGTVRIDPETLATSVPGLFAGGDVVFGPRIAIEAIANGKRGALSIHRYLKGESPKRGKVFFQRLDFHRGGSDFEKVARLPIPAEPAERRTGFREVETGYDLPSALREASRCLYCHVNTIFDSKVCILCGGCVDVCPYSCLQIVSPHQVEGPPELAALLGNCQGAIIKDETQCIRCALCAERCPTGAITMELFSWEGMPTGGC